jgi:hypothetical protein
MSHGWFVGVLHPLEIAVCRAVTPLDSADFPYQAITLKTPVLGAGRGSR